MGVLGKAFYKPDSVSAIEAITLVSAGTLEGILVGTAWGGALLGAGLMLFIALVITPVTRGNVDWGFAWVFIPMGAVGGALFQLAFWDMFAKQFSRNKS